MKNDDNLLTAGVWEDVKVPDIDWGPLLCFYVLRFSFKIHKNLSCLEVSITLLNNDDTLLEDMKVPDWG